MVIFFKFSLCTVNALSTKMDVHLVSAFIIEIHFFNYRGIFPLSISAALHYSAYAGKINGCIVLTRQEIHNIRI